MIWRPKCTPWWPARSGATPFQSVKFEPVRSAEPPSISGSRPASSAMANCDALRVATVSPLATVACRKASNRAAKPSGSSPFMRRVNSAASAGYWAA
ncbi:Uncharacterised protein [Bordetella pertussis]|nr:Uncharacterised protein [Bordetella pertussis]